MKYADGNDVRVGDEIVSRSCGITDRRAIVTSIDPPQRKLVWAEDAKAQLGIPTTLSADQWTLLRRASPTAEVQEKGPVDKHGREMRAGDLVAYVFTPGRVQASWEPSARGHEESHATMVLSGGRKGAALWFYGGRYYSADKWEILSRGLPTDPVPASYEPKRDAEGRPMLDAPELSGAAVAIMNEQAERSLSTIPAPPPAPERTAESLMADRRAKAKAEAEALQGRYAAFRETVERTVAAEAPHARVVTDRGKGTSFIADIDFGHGERRILVFGWLDPVESRLRGVIETVGRNIGARALRNPAQAARREG